CPPDSLFRDREANDGGGEAIGLDDPGLVEHERVLPRDYGITANESRNLVASSVQYVRSPGAARAARPGRRSAHRLGPRAHPAWPRRTPRCGPARESSRRPTRWARA